MPVAKIQREELNLVKEAAERVAHRTNSQFVIREERVEITKSKPEKAPSPAKRSQKG
jgi:dihydroneopterin aldolase